MRALLLLAMALSASAKLLVPSIFADGCVLPAVAALNRAPLGSAPANVSCSWEELGLPAGALAAARDLYAHAELGAFTGSLSLAVPPHASRLVKLVLQ